MLLEACSLIFTCPHCTGSTVEGLGVSKDKVVCGNGIDSNGLEGRAQIKGKMVMALLLQLKEFFRILQIFPATGALYMRS